MRRTEEEYRRIFRFFPDLASTRQFRNMLGGIGEVTALHLLQSGAVPSFKVGGAYRIPKEGIIQYVVSKEYAEYQKLLKHQIDFDA